MNKKAMNMLDHWAEMVTLLLLVLGLLISLFSGSKIVTYITIIICGFVVGKLYYQRRAKVRLPFYVLVIGFLLGYLIGVMLHGRGSVLVVTFLFIIGIYLGYYLYEQRILR